MTTPNDTMNPSGIPGSETDSNVFFHDLLERIEWLLLLTAVVLVVCLYPLYLNKELMDIYWGWVLSQPSVVSNWVRMQIEHFLTFSHSPLILKGVIATIPALIFMAINLIRAIVFPEHYPLVRRMREERRWLIIPIFFGWMLISAFWSPTPAVARTFALIVVIFGGFLYLVVLRGFSRVEMQQSGVMLMLIGIPVAVIVFLEALPIFGGKIFAVFHYFDNERNMFGSLLGHNTSAAAYLMMSGFPAFAFALGTHRMGYRLLCIGYLAMVLFAELILQSRSIWILGFVLGFLALWTALRRMEAGHLRWLPTMLLAILCLILLTQAIDRPWNPLYVRENPVSERLKDLTPRAILTDTRIRNDVIGFWVFLERPIVGHGLYAFQYIYPERVGAYFNENPESVLNQTIMRPRMAHNEYLQIAVDHGAIGLGLMVAMFWAYCWSGWRRRHEFEGGDRLLHQAFGWLGLGLLLHSLVDFPLHVPQLAVPGLLGLSVWASVRPARAEGTEYAPQPQRAPEAGARARALEFRLGPFARLLMSCFLIFLIPVAVFPLMRVVQGDILFSQGSSILQTVHEAPKAPAEGGMTEVDQLDWLRRAAEKLRSSIERYNANGFAYARLAECWLLVGKIVGEQDRALGMDYLQKGLALTNQALEYINYHSLHYQKAELYYSMWRISRNPEYRERYIANLEKTLDYSPSYAPAMEVLLRSYTVESDPDRERIVELIRHLRRHDAALFHENYIKAADLLIKKKEYAESAERWEELLAIWPEETYFLGATLKAQFLAGHDERVREILARMYRIDPDILYRTEGKVIEAALAGDADQMLAALDHITPGDLDHRALFRAIQLEALKRAGIEPKAWPSKLTRPADVAGEEWERLLAEIRPHAILHYFRDPSDAREAFEKRLTMAGEPPAEFWITGVRIGLALDDTEFARFCLSQAREVPSEPFDLDYWRNRIGPMETTTTNGSEPDQ